MRTGSKHIINSAMNSLHNDSAESEQVSPDTTKTTFKGPNARKSAMRALMMKGLKKATAE